MAANIEAQAVVKEILNDVAPYFNEKQRRILYGSAAKALGHGGIAFVNEVTGSARNTIVAGMNESESSDTPDANKGGSADLAGDGRALQKRTLIYIRL